MAVIVRAPSGDALRAKGRETALTILLRSRLYTAIKGLGLLLFFGSCGYWVLGRLYFAGLLEPKLEQHWSLLDCVFMTVITVSTIGYGETFPLEGLVVARLYTIALILTGMLLTAYFVSSATAFFVSGDLQKLLQRRRVMKEMKKLSGHYIVCGCGVTGRVILDELLATGHQVVVIENDPERLEVFQQWDEVLAIEGDATHDEILEAAGIERAAGLAAALSEDRDNLFLIISARQLRPELRIVSRASDAAVQSKLNKAGADAVVSPSFIGGLRLASVLIRPAVVSFLDLMLRRSDAPVRFAEVRVGEQWEGKVLRELQVRRRTGLPVLAVKALGQDMIFNPDPNTLLTKGMALVTMGETARVQQLDLLLDGSLGGATFIGGGDDDDDEGSPSPAEPAGEASPPSEENA